MFQSMNFPYSGLLSLVKNSQGSILYNVNPSVRGLIRFSVHKHVVHDFPFLSLRTQQILVQHDCGVVTLLMTLLSFQMIITESNCTMYQRKKDKTI